VNEGAILRKLMETNLWRRGPGWEQEDRDLKSLRRSPFSYEPRPFDDIVPGGLYVLRGPRRVGKSLEVKRAISDLIHRGVDPKRIIHFACDELSRGDLSRLYRVGHDSLSAGVSESRYWFLDEITSVPGWPAAIKNLRDTTDFSDDCVVLTGSSAKDLDEATKELAGRRGPAHPSDRILLPMSFRSFAAAIGLSNLPALPAVSLSDLLEPELGDALYELMPWMSDLASAWELHLVIGGYPRAVSDHLDKGDVQPDFVAALWDVIHGDALKAMSMEAAAAHNLLVRLTKNLATPMNMSEIASEIGVERGETARARVKALVDSYLVWPCHQRGQHNLPNLDAQSKYYFTDPLLARIANYRLPQSPLADSSAISEQQVGMALLRRIEVERTGTYADFTSVMYTRTASKKEVDFVGPVLGNLGVEGKYVDAKWKQESLTVKAQFGRGLLATRSVFDITDSVWAVPAGMLAWLL
jgi:predicted AAA+ superfamily ATPase